MLVLGGMIGLACILLAWTGGYMCGLRAGWEQARQVDIESLENRLKAAKRALEES